jgi:toxin ParE1/3/4
MRRTVFIRPRARADLVEIAAYIARGSPASSSRFLEASERCFRMLARFPELGTITHFKSLHLHGMRRFRIKGFENYLVFYRRNDDGIEIIRVPHGARDIESVFE